jgi:hypothetical protein
MMSTLLPHRFLFRYSFPVAHEKSLPRGGTRLLGLKEAHRLPDFGGLDDAPGFGELRMAWNQQGLAISAQVRGKRKSLHCDPATPDRSDGLQVWIDTRNTQSIHRASRFCHHFCLTPRGGGRDEDEPLAVQLQIARAKEATPTVEIGDIRLTADVARDGYLLEAWLPASVLHGYDPDVQNRLGFYYDLFDAELGEQTLGVGPEFPFAFDPSLWATLELVK